MPKCVNKVELSTHLLRCIKFALVLARITWNLTFLAPLKLKLLAHKYQQVKITSKNGHFGDPPLREGVNASDRFSTICWSGIKKLDIRLIKSNKKQLNLTSNSQAELSPYIFEQLWWLNFQTKAATSYAFSWESYLVKQIHNSVQKGEAVNCFTQSDTGVCGFRKWGQPLPWWDSIVRERTMLKNVLLLMTQPQNQVSKLPWVPWKASHKYGKRQQNWPAKSIST